MQGIVAGDYQLVYLSPESLLYDENLRNMLCSKVYIDNLVALAVDEAHCIDTWLVADFNMKYNDCF